MNKKIVFKDGTEIFGTGFGSKENTIAEIVFNTSMTGYQEIMSDKSYGGQAVVMTYPLIGTYGICLDDFESNMPALKALIVKEYSDYQSNHRQVNSLEAEMIKWNVVGVAGIDTRMLTRKIRNEGSQNVAIVNADVLKDDALNMLESWEFPRNIIEQVTRQKSEVINPNYSTNHIVAVDHGIKMSIVDNFVKHGCKVTIVPYGTSINEILNLKPDGVFLSNGPGDPEWASKTIELVRQLQGKLPIFGICLGHQIIALANGGKTYKMKFGHRGGNHSVKNLKTNKIEITSQNHSFAVDVNSLLKTPLKLSHINVIDKTCEGLEADNLNIFSVQYHPESNPGPEDSDYLFNHFMNNIEKGRN